MATAASACTAEIPCCLYNCVSKDVTRTENDLGRLRSQVARCTTTMSSPLHALDPLLQRLHVPSRASAGLYTPMRSTYLFPCLERARAVRQATCPRTVLVLEVAEQQSDEKTHRSLREPPEKHGKSKSRAGVLVSHLQVERIINERTFQGQSDRAH